MKKISVLIASLLASTPSVVLADGVFGGYNPGFAMVMDVAQTQSRQSEERICGRDYSNDNERAYLLRLQASGQCARLTKSPAVNRGVGSVVTQKALAPVSTLYQVSPLRTRQNMASFLSMARQNNAAGGAEMERLFASTDIMGVIRRGLAAKGLSANNVADVFAAYWMASWQASRSDFTDYGATTYKAVAAQAARGLSSTPVFAQATDAKKQEMAEMMLMQTLVVDSAQSSARGNTMQLRAIAQSARQGARNFGLNLDAMTLTEQGFVPVGVRRR